MSAQTVGKLVAGAGLVNDVNHHMAVLQGNSLKVIALTGFVGAADDAESEANARRIAACWNACGGVETQFLEFMEREESTFEQILDSLVEHSETMQLLAAAAEVVIEDNPALLETEPGKLLQGLAKKAKELTDE